MVMETLEMEVPRFDMTGRHSSLDKVPHSHLSIREVIYCAVQNISLQFCVVAI